MKHAVTTTEHRAYTEGDTHERSVPDTGYIPEVRLRTVHEYNMVSRLQQVTWYGRVRYSYDTKRISIIWYGTQRSSDGKTNKTDHFELKPHEATRAAKYLSAGYGVVRAVPRWDRLARRRRFCGGGLPEGRYGKMFPFVYRGMGMEREGEKVIWFMGWDGSTRFLDGTASGKGSRTCREHGREIGRECS